MTSPFELGLTMSGSLSVVGSALLLLGGEQRAGPSRAVYAVAKCIRQLVVLPVFSVL